MCTCATILAGVQVLQHMEDVKVREMQIFDYKKKIAEAETKLKQQQNLYEAVRSDRNLYSKNLIESQVYTSCNKKISRCRDSATCGDALLFTYILITYILTYIYILKML